MTEEFLWSEKYRPQAIKDCILPDRLQSVFQSFVDQKNIPNLLLTGTAGVGKTTVAMAMCEELGVNYLLINASKERGMDVIRSKITSFASTLSIRGGRKVIILDEADNLTTDAQMALRGVTQEFSQNCSFIMTCNFKARIMDALHSRSTVVDFKLTGKEKAQMAAQFMKRLRFILGEEGVTFDSGVLIKIIEKYFPDYRRTINELQSLASANGNNLDPSVVDQLTDIRKMGDLKSALKDQDFSAMRKWVVLNSDIDVSTIFRKIYDSCHEFVKPSSIPQVIVILAKYQYQAAFVADQEINLVACLTEMMVDCEFE